MSRGKAAKLVVRTPSGQRYEFLLEQDLTIIGRGQDCALVLDDQHVSRCHARIYREAGSYILVDEGSTNGTFVGGGRVHTPHTLAHRDEIRIGGTSLVFFQRGSDDSTTKRLEAFAGERPHGPIVVDLKRRDVWVEGRKLEERLSVLEFKLLTYLYEHPNAVCAREELCNQLWGEGAYTYEMLHQVVHRLKQRIEPDPRRPRYLITVPAVGYKLRLAT